MRWESQIIKLLVDVSLLWNVLSAKFEKMHKNNFNYFLKFTQIYHTEGYWKFYIFYYNYKKVNVENFL